MVSVVGGKDRQEFAFGRFYIKSRSRFLGPLHGPRNDNVGWAAEFEKECNCGVV